MWQNKNSVGGVGKSAGHSDSQRPTCSTAGDSGTNQGQTSNAGSVQDHDFRNGGCCSQSAGQKQLDKCKADLMACRKEKYALTKSNKAYKEKLRVAEQNSSMICECAVLTVDLNECKTELKESRAELDKCREQCKDLAETNKDQKARIEFADEKIQQLSDELSEVKLNETLATQLQSKMQEMSANLQSEQHKQLRAQLTKCESDLQMEKKRHAETIAKLENAQKTVQKPRRGTSVGPSGNAMADYGKFAAELKKLDAELYKTKLAAAEQRFRESDAEAKKLTATLIEAVAEHAELENKIRTLEAKLEANNRFDAGNFGGANAEAAIKMLNDKLSRSRMAEESLKSQIKDTTEVCDAKENALYLLAVELEKYKSDLKVSAEKCSRLEADSIAMKEKKDASDADIQKLKWELSLAVAKEFELKEKVREGDNEVAHLEKLLKEKLDQMKYSARNVDKLKHDVRSLETVVERRNREKKTLKADIDSLEKKLQDERKSKKKIDDPENELSQVWKKYMEKQKAILNLQAEMEAARKLEHSMGMQLEACGSELVEARRQLKVSQKTLEEERFQYIEEVPEKTRKEFGQYAVENGKLKQSIQKFEHQVEELVKRLQALVIEVKQLRTENATAEKKIQELSKEKCKSEAEMKNLLDAKTREFQEQKWDLDTEIEGLKTEKAQVEAKLQETQKLLEEDQKLSTDEKLKKDLDNSIKRRKELFVENDRLKQQLRKSEQSVKESEKRALTAEAQLLKLSAEKPENSQKIQENAQKSLDSETERQQNAKIQEMTEHSAKLEAKIAELDEKVACLQAKLEDAQKREAEWKEDEKHYFAMKSIMQDCFTKMPASADRKRTSDNFDVDEASPKRQCHTPIKEEASQNCSDTKENKPYRKPSQDWMIGPGCVVRDPNLIALQDSVVNASKRNETDVSCGKDIPLTPDSTSNHEPVFPNKTDPQQTVASAPLTTEKKQF
ncbi:hypothetical protein Ddc_18387 [Ditylenchus destructor]|nr:hypothetical protein Ddc_18387 [Ditylenchus destructor]